MPSDLPQAIRVMRHLGLALLLTAGPSSALIWSESGARMGVIVLAVQLYVGIFGAFALPRILAKVHRDSFRT